MKNEIIGLVEYASCNVEETTLKITIPADSKFYVGKKVKLIFEE